jgi:hypothetical protein
MGRQVQKQAKQGKRRFLKKARKNFCELVPWAGPGQINASTAPAPMAPGAKVFCFFFSKKKCFFLNFLNPRAKNDYVVCI